MDKIVIQSRLINPRHSQKPKLSTSTPKPNKSKQIQNPTLKNSQSGQ